MKILVLLTGGTIGSTVKDGWISTDNSVKYTLIENYKRNFGEGITFEIREPYFALSENLCNKNLNLLINSVDSALSEDFDGIIITHGTDTLHFSAAAADLAFGNTNTPIVFVSANYPLEDARSNGHANFEGAVALIKSGINSGVYISYKNPKNKHYIHLANKALSFSESDDSIYSLYNTPFAVYSDGKIEITGEIKDNPVSEKTDFCENPNILVISTVPGDSFGYDISKYNAVILRPYHSGTLNTENLYFKSFTERARAENIPVFLANAPASTTYETVKDYSELGIIPLPDSTFATVYMKIWAGISENKNLKNLF